MRRTICRGGKDGDEEIEGGDEDKEADAVPQDDGDDLVLSDPKGLTLSGCLVGNWKISRKYLLHVIAQLAHILTHHPVVQAFVKVGKR